MSAVEIKTVADEEVEIRLDRWFRRYFPDLSHGHLQKLIRTGQVRVDGKRVQANQRLVPGQKVRIPPLADAPEQRRADPSQAGPEDAAFIRSMVIHRDDWVITINKPPGLAVQGGSRTLRHLDAMLGALQGRSRERPRLVHRLDKDTSGVLLLAANAESAKRLGAAFRGRQAGKLYWAVTVGVPAPLSGQIDLSLSKQQSRGGERVVAASSGGKRAVTHYRVVETVGGNLAFVALMPTTGRTHQLRVHMAAVGAPILGDGKYGGKAAFLEGLEFAKRLHLHARRIVLPHPSGSGVLDVMADPPQHMAETLAHFGLDTAGADDLLAELP